MINEVQGVAVLNLRHQLNHFFNCKTSEGEPDDLLWEKEEQVVRFNTELREETMRMYLDDFTSDDEGVYTCVNSITSQRLSIKILAGKYKLCIFSNKLASKILGLCQRVWLFCGGSLARMHRTAECHHC